MTSLSTQFLSNQWLRSEFSRRKKRNQAYSLRSFARDCRVSLGLMSQILNDQKPLTPRTARQISIGLALDVKRERELRTLVGASQVNDSKSTAAASSAFILEEDSFRVIADWHHFAVLAVFDMPHKKVTVPLIAKTLNLDSFVVRESFDLMTRLGLIKKDGSNFVLTRHSEITTSDETLSDALQKYHRQILDKASQAIVKYPVDERDFLNGTVAGDSRKIPAVKSLMRKYRDELMQILEGGTPDRIYSINLNVFPLSE